jgi:predicted Zn-dependent protease with MMP-like domain
MRREEFERLAAEALDDLPVEFAEKMSNIEVVIDDWPTRSQMRRAGVGPGGLLLGLYEGVPLTRRDRGYHLVLPDKITIFQRPIEAVCRTNEEIRHLVRKTVMHEIAHHFGIGDERLRGLEKDG